MTDSMSPGFCFKSGGRCTETLYYKPRQVFAAFPFEDPYYFLFDEIVKPTIEGLKNSHGRYNLKMVDARSQTVTRDFMCSIIEGIRSSRFAIVDLSLLKANVYLELGVMIGLGLTTKRPFILVSNFQDRPAADISSVNMVGYHWDRLDDFKSRLETTCLDTFRLAAPAPPVHMEPYELLPYQPTVAMPGAPSYGGLDFTDFAVDGQKGAKSNALRRHRHRALRSFVAVAAYGVRHEGR